MGLLINTVRETAVAEQALEVRLYVHAANSRAVKAYQRAGFEELPYRIMGLRPLDG